MEFCKTVVKTLGIIVLATVMSACNIKAYRVLPVEHEDLKVPAYSAKKESIIYFNVPQLFEEESAVSGREEPLVRVREFAAMLEHALVDNPTFEKAVLTSAPSEKGSYVSVTVRGENHFSLPSVLYLLLSSCTLTIIPYYTDDIAEYIISYELYQNSVSVKTYRYRVQQKTLVWLMVPLAIPFIRDSWGTPAWVGLKEIAFAETAKFMWIDAHRDGLF
jgi:hypothetical protein